VRVVVFKKLAYCLPGRDNKEAFTFKKYLTDLAVIGFNLDHNATVKVPNGFTELLSLKDSGINILAVVQNLVKGGFDGKMLEEILSSRDLRKKLVENCVQLVKTYNLSGVHINFEGYKGDPTLLNGFMRELSYRLRPNASVSIALPAKTKNTTWFKGYDYYGLSHFNDFALLMTYDLHWPGGDPGPVSSVPWMGKVVNYALSRGWNEKQLFLGVPLYGYDWPEKGKAKAILHSQVMDLLDTTSHVSNWDAYHGESHFSYINDNMKHYVWYQDIQSVGAKAALAQTKGLAGIGFWRLGFQFNGMWEVL